MTDNEDRHTVKMREAANNRRIIRVSTIAVYLSIVFEKTLDEVQRVRPIWMTGELHALKRGSRVFLL